VWHLYVALLADPTPRTGADVAWGAGWAASGPLSVRAARTVAQGLARLAGAGLAVCDEHGRWTAVAVEQATDATRAAAGAGHAQRVAVVEAERAAYAVVRDRRGAWQRQRDQAWRRGAVARQLGARRWWAGLDPAEQERRRAVWAQRYRDLPPAGQAQVKTRLAERRQLAGGLTEDQLHEAWTASIAPAVYEARSAARARWFRGLPLATQRELVTGWQAHRDRWAIHRRPPPRPAVTDSTPPAEAAAIGLLVDLVGARPHPHPVTALEESA
jgi:hypothetical protein